MKTIYSIIYIIFYLIFILQAHPSLSSDSLLYRYDLALVPGDTTIPINNLNKIYLINNYIIFHGIVEVDKEGARIIKVYISSINIALASKLVQETFYTALKYSSNTSSIKNEEYYLTLNNTHLIYCKRLQRAHADGVDILYSSKRIPVRGIIVLGSYKGSELIAFFDILVSSNTLCGHPVLTRNVKIALILLSSILGIGVIPSYLYYRRRYGE